MNKLMALLAFAVLTGFLAILAIWIKRIDLSVLIGVTILMAGYDFLLSSKSKR